MTDDQVYRLLQTAFNTKAVKELEKTMISEATQAVIQATEDKVADAET